MSVLDSPTRPFANLPLIFCYLLALVVPPLFAFSLTPSPTLLNQLLSVGGWGLCLAMQRAVPPMGARRHVLIWLTAPVSLMALAVIGSWTLGSLPTSLALPPLFLLIIASLIATLAARAAQSGGPDGIDAFAPFAIGMVVVGLLSTGVAVVQVFAPDYPDGDFIARSGLVGRAVGNLRQPNHLASLLVWSVIALVPLIEWRRVPRWLGAILGAAMIFGVLLSGSRTGLYGGIFVLVAWGAADFRLSKSTRIMLVATLAVAVVMWLGLAEWSAHSHHVFGAKERLSEGDSSHFAIWRNTLTLIAQQPWLGVGWGEFNFAWTLTPFPDRPVAFFDHTHDLPLQFAVELGLPLAALVVGLLIWALVLAAARAWSTRGPAGHGARAAWVMVLMIAIHSLDEYPLWYAYFLLPTAWAWGFAMGSGPAPRPITTPMMSGVGNGRATESSTLIRLSSEGNGLRWFGVLMMAGALFSAWDYWRISTIFDEIDTPPLATRIASGQRSIFFAHHADYADATTAEPPSRALGALERATHSLLDARLMIAWATALAESGQVDRARYVAARLREFRKTDADEFFAPCKDADVALKPFQCDPEPSGLTWRDFH